ncbi:MULTISPECIES: cell division protein FtsQ/DivIB [Paenibacillus]|uniref:FtsQ-type POTRA domain-containing protein n=1 Tax=Paenibacillus whitsoniae TaxID=2496558 RepID=A0A3S0AJJ8_9BACL|nr:FtsQ-type POTRA domain-containing protein [Paenibacillus whitsoniae]RTE00252.1 FtsQ-type POTRA domain-containing protein [Paenibacillus whitsoniae]
MSEDRKVPALPVPKPRARSNRKMLIFLILFFITVLVVLFFQSSLSRISQIEIEGNELIAPDVIEQASQVAVGDRFFAASSSAIAARVAKLPMIQHADVDKHFPGLLKITVQEFPKVAFQLTADGKKQAVLADGAVTTLPPGTSIPLDMPILTGWDDSNPNKAALCKALGEIPQSALSDVSEIKPEPSESYPDKIKLYTRSQYEVITTIAYLPDKIDSLPGYIASLQEQHISNGVITLLEAEYHTPYETVPDDAKSDAKTTPKPTPKNTPKNTPKP